MERRALSNGHKTVIDAMKYASEPVNPRDAQLQRVHAREFRMYAIRLLDRLESMNEADKSALLTVISIF